MARELYISSENRNSSGKPTFYRDTNFKFSTFKNVCFCIQAATLMVALWRTASGVWHQATLMVMCGAHEYNHLPLYEDIRAIVSQVTVIYPVLPRLELALSTNSGHLLCIYRSRFNPVCPVESEQLLWKLYFRWLTLSKCCYLYHVNIMLTAVGDRR